MAQLRRTRDPEAATRRLLKQQLRDFRRKFGRDPLPGEPVFFDPEQDVPTEMTEEQVREDMLKIMAGGTAAPCVRLRKDGAADDGGDGGVLRPADVAEYKAAIDEYFRLEAEGEEQ